MFDMTRTGRTNNTITASCDATRRSHPGIDNDAADVARIPTQQQENVISFTEAVTARQREHDRRQSRRLGAESADYDYEEGIDDTARWAAALGAENAFAAGYAERAAWLRATYGEVRS